MARNKYPEQTIEKILSVSAKLFAEKGYDKTTIQDIIDTVGMSKGIIYYHFKSKEDILDAVLRVQLEQTTQMQKDLSDSTKAANAREKVGKILERSIEIGSMENGYNENDLTLLRSPQYLVNGLKEAVRNAPFLSEILRDGIKDGSVTTENPDEIAEIFMLLFNFWSSPVLYERTYNETSKRLKFLQNLLSLLGADILSNDAIEKYLKAYQGGYKNEK